MTTTAEGRTPDAVGREVRIYQDGEGGLSLWVPGSHSAWGDAEFSGSCLDRDAVSLIARGEPHWPPAFLRFNTRYGVWGEDDVRGVHVMSYKFRDGRRDGGDTYFVRFPLPGWYERGPLDFRSRLIAHYIMGERPSLA